MSRHVFSVADFKPQVQLPGGTRASITSEQFPILNRMALYRLTLNPKGVREPHWHPNAHEMAYCVRGDLLITIFSDGSQHDTLYIRAGDMFFVPSGYMHHIENVGDSEAEVIIAFSHENPEDIGLSGAVGCMSNSVLGNTFQLPSGAFDGLRKLPTDTFIGMRKEPAAIPDYARFPNRHKFTVENISAQLATASGSAKMAKKAYWPILEDLSMFSLRLADTGMREPHWHPRTAEMGYVLKGNARMTLLTPGGDVDTYTLKPGDMYFLPRGYPHHIENTGPGEIHFLVFFDQGNGEDIGYTGCVRAYSNEVLGATFGCEAKFFEKLPPYTADLLVVKRVNPIDP